MQYSPGQAAPDMIGEGPARRPKSPPSGVVSFPGHPRVSLPLAFPRSPLLKRGGPETFRRRLVNKHFSTFRVVTSEYGQFKNCTCFADWQVSPA
jgi:hypothetical protein